MNSVVVDRTAPAVAPPNGRLLDVRGLRTSYGRVEVLHDISLYLMPGELVTLVGGNGAGKSTLLRTIHGLQRAHNGSIGFLGSDITHLRPDQRVRLGICQSPEGRQVFSAMTVEDNLMLGGYVQPKAESLREIQRMFELFPVLAEFRHSSAGTLSGGQQQMLSLARALMGRPKLLLLDEPSMGLAPLLVSAIFQIISRLARDNMTILLVEQNAQEALSIADRGYVIEAGRMIQEGPAKDLLRSERLKEAYLGQ